jgi:hypothetical protein
MPGIPFIGTLCRFSWRLRPETATAILLRTDGSLREEKGRMRMLLRDIVLFSCLAAFVAGLVIAAATLLI